jgi:hypothetical protein
MPRRDWRTKGLGRRESRLAGEGTPSAPAGESPDIAARHALNLPGMSTEGLGTVKINVRLRIKGTDELTDLNLQMKGK